jgi:hypothetical protein
MWEDNIKPNVKAVIVDWLELVDENDEGCSSGKRVALSLRVLLPEYECPRDLDFKFRIQSSYHESGIYWVLGLC